MLGGRATAFDDPAPANGSTTASTSCSGATTRRSRFSGRSAPRIACACSRVSRSTSSIAGERGAGCALPHCRHPSICWRDCSTGRRSTGATAWRRSGWRGRSALRRSELQARAKGQTPTRIAASPGETVEEWLINNGQTARIREMLWEPLALAALNQSVRMAAAPPFAAVLAQMFGGGPRDASLALAVVSARRAVRGASRGVSSSRAAGKSASGARRGSISQNGRVAHVEARGDAPRCRRGRGRRALVCAARPVRGRHGASRCTAHGRGRYEGLVADRERQPLARSSRSANAVSGIARPIDAMGVRQGADVRVRDRRTSRSCPVEPTK